jgi:hypothetical protein
MRDIFEVDNAGPGASVHISCASLSLLDAVAYQKGRCICDRSPHELWIVSLEPCFCIRRKSDKMQRGVNDSRNSFYCHFCAWSFSHPGITRTIYICFKWYTHRPVKGPCTCCQFYSNKSLPTGPFLESEYMNFLKNKP